jgi:excisionase family DNA binding protein
MKKEPEEDILWADKTQSHVDSIMPRYDLALPDTIEQAEVHTSTEVTEIIGVSDQTIRRWCEQGKYPGAYQTKGGHWRITKKYFKVSLEEARKRNAFEQDLNDLNAKYGEVNEDEFL